MKYLFIHQNFPGQFRHLAPALASLPGHTVVALAIQPGTAKPLNWRGVTVIPYPVQGANVTGLHPWLKDMETKTIRAEACWRAMHALKRQGFAPDVVIAHPGWGEPLFAKQVWPQTRLGIYAEFFYRLQGADVGFETEFAAPDPDADACRLQMKNLNHLAHLDVADAALSPTHWQADTFPEAWSKRIVVAHDGVDTNTICPYPEVRLALPGEHEALTRADEVVTFVARHLEPYRGFHVFMRFLPAFLKAHPAARVVVVGDDAVGYGASAPDGKTWRQIFTDEVRSQISDPDWERVTFLGRVGRETFTQMLQLSRVHIYLSYPFVLSWSLIEAMSAGAAIVASDTAPVREVIEHDVHGLLVNFFDRDELLQQISRLLADAPLRQRLGHQARARAQSEYDLASVCLPQQMAWAQGLSSVRA